MSVDLGDLCAAALRVAKDGEHVEAFVQESRRTEVRARAGDVESVKFSESRGVGVRLVHAGRLGYAWAADPSVAEVGATVARARENAALATEDEHNVLPTPEHPEALPGLFHQELVDTPTARKVELALGLDVAAARSDPRVRKVDHVSYSDSITRIAIASTRGVRGEYGRTDCWCSASTLAEEGDETQTGFAFRLARDPGGLDWMACAEEAARRAGRLLGARKPESGPFRVVLDPAAAVAFLGVLAGALSAESVQKGRSLFASLSGEVVASSTVNLVDDGRLLDGPGASPVDDEGVPTKRTPLIDRGRLSGFLHNTHTAHRGQTISTGNAGRAGFRSPPGVSSSNLFLKAGTRSPEDLLRQVDHGVYIQEVSGVHSGANAITGEFSVGATGLRITGGELGEPLREMTVASTLRQVLERVVAVGSDLRFFGSTGSPTVSVEEMTIGGT
ncbi:MAG TPA: TldD/PmbA family protein [Actinomycetota bacterium]|nr:TldD/PmbA family protein [Actinomycetota bacterium]